MFNVITDTTRLTRILLIFLLSKIPAYLFKMMLFSNLDREATLYKMGFEINKCLMRAGPSFIKLGQTLSTRPDLIGESLALALSKLQDKVPSFSLNKVKKTLEKEFKMPLDLLFQEFKEQPIAAASIAQVHQAITFDNQKVAVKILRPSIEKKFIRDLKLFYFITSFVLYIFPKCRAFKLNQALEILERSIKIETDLRLEAAAANQLRENFKNDESIYIPSIRWDITSKRVLTQEWVEGIPISDRKQLKKAGHDLHYIAKNLAITFFNQAYRDGFFHADIHPGNIMVSNQGKIILIDFGIMGHLEKEDRMFVAKTLYGFITRDYKSIADIHFDMGYVPKTQSRELFALACRSIGEPIVGMPVNKISIGKLLKQLFEISKNFDMNIQPKFLLLQKTLVTVEGTGYSLYPEVNMWQLAEPWIKDWAKKNFGLKGKLQETRLNMLHLYHDIPKTLRNISLFFEKMEQNISNEGMKIHRVSPTQKPHRQSVKVLLLIASGIIIGVAIKCTHLELYNSMIDMMGKAYDKLQSWHP